MSVLSDAAAALAPGQWTLISSTGINAAFAEPGLPDPSILMYTNSMVYSPTSGKLIYGGGTHYASGSPNHRLAVYDEATNTWAQTDPAWQNSSVMHSYDHMSINTTTNTIYYMNGDDMVEVDIATGLGGSGTFRQTNFGGNIFGTSYFPEIGKVVLLNNGAVFTWTPGGTSVPAIATGLATAEYHNFCEYSAPKACVVFGGGLGSRVWYKGVAPLTNSSHITRMPDCPVGTDLGDGNKSLVVTDPATGHILVFAPSGLFSLDPTGSGTWAQHAVNSDFYSHPYPSRGSTEATTSCPIPAYGVVAIIQHRPNEGTTYFRLYKHSSTPTPPPPPGTYTVTASPLSVAPGATVTITWAIPAGANGWVHLILKNLTNFDYDPNRWVSTRNATSGTFVTTAPNTPGTYQGRYVSEIPEYTTQGVSADVIVTGTPPPPPPPPGGGQPMPTLADEINAYARFGWGYAQSALPNFTGDPGYVVTNPDIHGDTEMDDLWSYTMMFRRTGQQGANHRMVAWRNYDVNIRRSSSSYANDRDGFINDHAVGYGAVTYYELTGDTAALNFAIAMAGDVEPLWINQSSYQIAYWGPRGPARHLLIATRVAEATNASRWIALRNKLIDLIINSSDFNATHGMYFSGPEYTNSQTVLGSGGYEAGGRAISALELGVLFEALWQAYRTTGRTDIRARLVAMSTWLYNFGTGSQGFFGSFFGYTNINNLGSKFHRSQDEPGYTTMMVNAHVIGYKLTGTTTFLDRAKQLFMKANGAVYGQPTQRTVPDGQVHHFVDTRFDTSNANFYLDGHGTKGELFYTYLLFENGGAPTVEGATPDVTPPVITYGVPTVLQTQATLRFTTNELADTEFEWGLTTSYGSTSGVLDANPNWVTTHAFTTPASLASGTLYHYRAKSRDVAGNLAIGTDQTFTTAAVADVTGPVIGNVAEVNVTQTGWVVTFTTDEAATAVVDYGLDVSYGNTTVPTTVGTSHSIPITSATALTLYHYRIRATDLSGNQTTGADREITTLPVPPAAASRLGFLVEELSPGPPIEYKTILLIPVHPSQYANRVDPNARKADPRITDAELSDIRAGRLLQEVFRAVGTTIQAVEAAASAQWDLRAQQENNIGEFANSGRFLGSDKVWRPPT